MREFARSRFGISRDTGLARLLPRLWVVICIAITAVIVALTAPSVPAQEPVQGTAHHGTVTPKLLVSPKSLKFGKKVTQAVTKSFEIKAENGSITGTVGDPTGKGSPAYRMLAGSGDFNLGDGDSVTVMVLFVPPKRGTFKATVPITYQSNSKTKNTKVGLKGSAAKAVELPTPTATATSGASGTPTATATATSIASRTPTATKTANATPSSTATATVSATSTSSATKTATATATQTSTATQTATATSTPTVTPTATATTTPLPLGSIVIVGGQQGGGSPCGSFTRTIGSFETYDYTTGLFVASPGPPFPGAMVIQRTGHTATLLPNGKVLLVGGQDNLGNTLGSAEIYDPFSKTSTATASLLTARTGHSATLLTNGKVLIAGGTDVHGSVLELAELYDPTTGKFTSSTSLMNQARWGHSATLLADGTVLLAGGGSGGLNVTAAAETYDPVADSFSPIGSMNSPRTGHTATLLPSGQVLFAGGFPNLGGGGAGPVPVNSAEVYDPAHHSFTATGSMTTTREAHVAALLSSGQVLIAGGLSYTGEFSINQTTNAAELYDPTSGQFTSTGSMIYARHGFAAMILPNGQVLVAAGLDFIPFTSEYTSATAEIYDPSTGQFSVTGSLTEDRASFTATLLPNGMVLLAGGIQEPPGNMNATQIYDPAAGSFSATTPLLQDQLCIGFTVTSLDNGDLLVAGGENGGTSDAELLIRSSPTVFHTPGTMTTARTFHTATLLSSGMVLIAGGESPSSSGNATTTAELYDPKTFTFSPTGSMSSARSIHTATPLGNGLVLMAGGNIAGNCCTTIGTAELYDPAKKSFAATGDLVTGRMGQTATLLPSGKVLIAGGVYNPTATDNTLSSAELYDYTSGAFTATGSMTVPRVLHTATLLLNGQVLIAGGTSQPDVERNHLANPPVVYSSAELYDPASATFSATGSMIDGRAYHTATLLATGQVLIVGGEDAYGAFPSTTEIYDPDTGTFSSGPRIVGDGIIFHTATILATSGTGSADQTGKLNVLHPLFASNPMSDDSGLRAFWDWMLGGNVSRFTTVEGFDSSR